VRDAVFYSKKTLNLRGKILDLHTPVVMGILNVTPDSFYDGGRHNVKNSAVTQVGKMLEEGATLIDIGGYSTRPQAPEVSEEEELARVIPIIEHIIRTFPEALISIDTFRAKVAKEAIEAGACMINDISGGSLDEQMFEMVSHLKVPYVLMHTRGTPQNMAELTDYQDIMLDLVDYFHQKLLHLRALGVSDIIIDVGFGFAKTLEQNFELLKQLSYFRILNLPLLVGISRKSMVWKTLDIQPDEALNGTTVLNTWSLLHGASILRVHDVKQAVETIKLLNYSN
jgi:dihydropteroate synthase